MVLTLELKLNSLSRKSRWSASVIYSAKILQKIKLEVILGDNVFFGKGLEGLFNDIKSTADNALFTQKVNIQITMVF